MYSPTDENSYGYVDFDDDCLIDLENKSEAVQYLITEFMGHTKSIVKKDEAYDYWKYTLKMQDIELSKDDLQYAYDLAFGYGCEFEWN